jgi:DNA recombination protein RmuC
MQDALLLINVVLTALALALLLFIVVQGAKSGEALPEARLLQLEGAITRLDGSVRQEFYRGREESGKDAQALREEIARRLQEANAEAERDGKELREELRSIVNALGEGVGARIAHLGGAQGGKLDAVTAQIQTLTDGNERRQETLRDNLESKLGELKSDAAKSARDLREEVAASLKSAGELLTRSVDQISRTQQERLDRLSQAIGTLAQTVEGRLDSIRKENSEKLEQMRATVDEKLQSTLESRLGESFRRVSEQLERVHQGIGEMQSLATGVGDLKKVLTNVKSRGTWGEVALGGLLEQVMTADQYGVNVEIEPGSGQRVEFALRLPGDDETPVWLPIDAKFPMADYELLVNAAERGDAQAAEAASRAVEVQIRKAAKDISEKYVRPPWSTDFAVLFVPTEGLFAEVLRRPGLVDGLQREHRVMVAGPTTLASLLTALRMGFRSLAIQKRSSEVWKVLGAVKVEFSKFGNAVNKVSKKLDEAQKVIQDDVRCRHRAMDRKLRAVEELPEPQAVALLGLTGISTAMGLEDEEEREAAE